jgi:excisionase family DNA binding protein
VDRELISTRDAAAILNVSRERVEQLSAEGKLGPIAAETVGRTRVLFRRFDVERLRVERGVGRYGRT